MPTPHKQAAILQAIAQNSAIQIERLTSSGGWEICERYCLFMQPEMTYRVAPIKHMINKVEVFLPNDVPSPYSVFMQLQDGKFGNKAATHFYYSGPTEAEHLYQALARAARGG